MARIELTTELNFEEISNYYTDTSLELRRDNDEKAVFVDTDTGNRIIFEGDDFSSNGNSLTAGTVDEVTFRNADGEEFAVIRDADYNAEKLSDLLLDKSVDAMLRYAFRQDDLVVGSSGRDLVWTGNGDDVLRGKGARDMLEGGNGDDRLIGGGGADIFVFAHGDDKDEVVDFDASGGGRNQDYIGVESLNDFDVRKSGDDTIIDFDDGHTLTLLDVRRSQISDADFHIL
jgi:hypothetical protein